MTTAIEIPGDKSTTIQYATDHWISSANEAIASKGAFFVALSGGSTPKAIFQELAKRRSEISWKNVWVFWSDERAVEPDHPDSNYRMAMDAGFSKLGIPPQQIVRMEGEILDATGYEKSIRELIPNSSFDLIMLGMGEDGHTASLFPNTTALEEKNNFVVINHIPQKQCDRLTFTYPLLSKAKEVVFYVLGAGKAEVLAKIHNEGISYPAGEVDAQQVIWILDKEAAKGLKQSLI